VTLESKMPNSAKRLVVGKNSKVVADLKLDREEYICVSHTDVNEFKVRGFFEDAIVFSYSKSLQENIKLLNNISRYTDNIIYISTTSTVYSSAGMLYQYPTVKLVTENYLRNTKIFKNVLIIKLGIVISNDTVWKKPGHYQITRTGLLKTALKQTQQTGQIECWEKTKIDFDNWLEKFMFVLYKKIQCRRTWRLLRLIDLILKYMGYRWYGYGHRYQK